MTTVLTGCLAGLAILLMVRPRPRAGAEAAGGVGGTAGGRVPPASLAGASDGSGTADGFAMAGLGGPAGEQWWLRRHRPLLCVGAGLAGPLWLGGSLGALVGAAAASCCWVAVGRAESGAVARDRRRREAELPHAVLLLALCLAGGAPVAEALRQVADALPGPATRSFRVAASRFAVGATADQAWRGVADDPALGRLVRALVRAGRTGAPVAEVVARLARELAGERRAGLEERARAVGVRAAVPLGLCLLPAFVLVGVVPVVFSTLASLSW